MSGPNPLVSILTPSYNQAPWLADNLRSVAAQTYPHVEHVVMDGGSTDGSVEILAQAQPAVRWQSEPDRGQSHALNKALAESRGEIIGWLNSDDAYADRRAVARAAARFAADPGLDVVYGDGLVVDGENRVLLYVWVYPFSRRLLESTNLLLQPSTFIRRSAIEDRFVREDLHYLMDRELWRRLAREGRRFARLRAVVGIDRHQEGRKTIAGRESYEAELELVGPGGRGGRTLTGAMRIGQRFAGAPGAFTVRRTLDPAIALVLPPALQQVRSQVLARRAGIAGAAGRTRGGVPA
jgi:glycosyltransferase involved in cell wall biosynthesis